MKLLIDPSEASAAASAFTTTLLPRVCAAEGFVAGYWLEPQDGEGLGVLVFATRESAAAATPPRTDWSAEGVVIQSSDIRRVAVSAGSWPGEDVERPLS